MRWENASTVASKKTSFELGFHGLNFPSSHKTEAWVDLLVQRLTLRQTIRLLVTYSVLTEELRGLVAWFSTLPVDLLFFLLEVERTGAVFLTREVGAGEAGTCVMNKWASSSLFFSLLSTGDDIAFSWPLPMARRLHRLWARSGTGWGLRGPRLA